MANSPAPNRNVVSRRVAVKPRVEARTTEIDCSQIAKMIEAQGSAVVPVIDLDAEIEVVAALSEGPARGSARFAHTKPREAAQMAVPEAPVIEAPKLAPPKLELPLPAPARETTMPMPSVTLAQLTAEPAPHAPSRSRGWIIFATVSVVVAVVALVGVAQL